MSDILSGGAIDETTSGPIPASQDNRSLDIIAETAAKQERDAIGGSQNPPVVEPPPPIPSPTEVTPPPLPDIDVSQLGIDFGSAAEATREIARQATVDVLKRVTIDGQGPVIEGSAISFNTERRSTASEDFGTGGNVNFLQPLYSQGRLESADFGSRAAMEDRSSANAYAAAEARRDARRMEDPSFNRESPERQRGETRRDFTERQERLQQERQQMAQLGIIPRRERDGDISELPSGMVPVKLTRADGQKKILALMATELVGVVEGASAGERTVTLPSENSYYEGGGTFNPHPWQVLLRTENGSTEYKVELNSNLYSGIGSWDNINITGLDFWTPISEGFLVLFGVVSDGVCTEASIQGPQAVPSDRIDFVDEEQSSFASQIAYLYQGADGGWVVRQLAFSDKTLVAICVDGKSAIYPIST